MRENCFLQDSQAYLSQGQNHRKRAEKYLKYQKSLTIGKELEGKITFNCMVRRIFFKEFFFFKVIIKILQI